MSKTVMMTKLDTPPEEGATILALLDAIHNPNKQIQIVTFSNPSGTEHSQQVVYERVSKKQLATIIERACLCP